MSAAKAKYDSIDRNIAANVRTWRDARGISQEDLAERMTALGFGFTQATVWKIESGQRRVQGGELLALADTLELMSVSYLAQEPDSARHTTQLTRAGEKAYDAYGAIKAATADYLKAQVELVFAARAAYDAGLRVTELDTSWLTLPPERAVLEARVDLDTEDERRDHLYDEVNKIVSALRGSGYEPFLRPEDVTFGGGGPLPLWTPDGYVDAEEPDEEDEQEKEQGGLSPR